tara:strand:- start:3900 stop:4412 length:513 start_codon:yes stop_codon:yes gene_type:complete
VKDYLKSEQNPRLISNQDIATLSKLNNHLTEQNFILFKKLILDSTVYDYQPLDEGKYSVSTYRLTNSSMPSIEVCIENLSKYTKHAYMCIDPLRKTGNVHFRPYTFRTKIYMDAKLIEVYDLSEESASKKLESGISKSLLKRSGIKQKIILSTIFNHWLKELISVNYQLS